ncbi:MAG: hypothetical protein RLZZ502_38, partial [Pseudomonadota bacterium]
MLAADVYLTNVKKQALLMLVV